MGCVKRQNICFTLCERGGMMKKNIEYQNEQTRGRK
jgi:hypothetical protein